MFCSCLPSLLAFCSLSASSLTELPKTQGKGFDGGIPFSTVCSKVSYSLHIFHLWVFLSACSHLLQEGAPLSAEQDTDLSVQQNVSRSHFIVVFL